VIFKCCSLNVKVRSNDLVLFVTMRLKQLPSFAKIIAPEICRVLCGDLTMSHKRLNGLFYSSRKMFTSESGDSFNEISTLIL